jgi:hypothetical protein
VSRETIRSFLPGLFVLLLLPVALLTSACGGSALALDPVASAATKTENAGSYNVKFDLSTTAEGQHIEFTGAGISDPSTNSAQVAFEFTGLPSSVSAAGTTGEMIMTNDTIYMQMPFLQSIIPGGKHWLELDLGQIAAQNGQQLKSFDEIDPQQWLQELLASGEAQNVGTDTVQGESMTHYHANIDPSKLSQVPADERAQVQADLQKLGLTTIPVDVWVDDQGMVRQEKMDLTVDGTETSLTTSLSDFGTAGTVTAPPADDVFDATSLATSQNG